MNTVEKTSFGQIEEKASRFLCEIMPYSLFESRLAELKSLHPKANHHVTAVRYLSDGQLFERGRDDGEPSGTSGIPSLRVLQGANLVNVATIVTRYFGGTKLGTGGLARAYAAAVNAALAASEVIPYVEYEDFEVKLPFSRSEKVERFLNQNPIVTVERSFTEGGVTFILNAPEPVIQSLKDELEF